MAYLDRNPAVVVVSPPLNFVVRSTLKPRETVEERASRGSRWSKQTKLYLGKCIGMPDFRPVPRRPPLTPNFHRLLLEQFVTTVTLVIFLS